MAGGSVSLVKQRIRDMAEILDDEWSVKDLRAWKVAVKWRRMMGRDEREERVSGLGLGI